MRASTFMQRVLDGLKIWLRKKNASLSDVARIAEAALTLVESHPEEIPDDAVERFFDQHPEVPGTSGFIRAKEEGGRRAVLERLHAVVVRPPTNADNL